MILLLLWTLAYHVTVHGVANESFSVYSENLHISMFYLEIIVQHMAPTSFLRWFRNESHLFSFLLCEPFQPSSKVLPTRSLFWDLGPLRLPWVQSSRDLSCSSASACGRLGGPTDVRTKQLPGASPKEESCGMLTQQG